MSLLQGVQKNKICPRNYRKFRSNLIRRVAMPQRGNHQNSQTGFIRNSIGLVVFAQRSRVTVIMKQTGAPRIGRNRKVKSSLPLNRSVFGPLCRPNRYKWWRRKTKTFPRVTKYAKIGYTRAEKCLFSIAHNFTSSHMLLIRPHQMHGIRTLATIIP